MKKLSSYPYAIAVVALLIYGGSYGAATKPETPEDALATAALEEMAAMQEPGIRKLNVLDATIKKPEKTRLNPWINNAVAAILKRDLAWLEVLVPRLVGADAISSIIGPKQTLIEIAQDMVNKTKPDSGDYIRSSMILGYLFEQNALGSRE